MEKELSFDGFGINGPDKYRSRIATFTNDAAGKAYGKLFEAAPDLLAALTDALESLKRLPDTDGAYRISCIQQCEKAISAAKGGAK